MIYGSMHDSSWMYRALNKYQPVEIYNLAAQSHVRVSFDVPIETVDSIAMGTLKLLEAWRMVCPTSKFYQASSSEMYGDNPKYPQNEETKFMPASPYACAKLFCHNMIRHYREAYGLFACSGILFNHESPRRGETFVTRKITIAAAKIKLGIQDKLYLGNLEAKRDWGHAADYVRGMWLMLQQDEPDDFVLATGITHSVRGFLDLVFKYADLNTDNHVEIDKRLFRPHEVPVLLGDPAKANAKLQWYPKYTIKDLVKDMYRSDFEEQDRLARGRFVNVSPSAYTTHEI
jgi:GDPmannose 4,6-dehydratase